MVVYNVIQLYKDYDADSYTENTDSYSNVFSFSNPIEAEKFLKIARKTQKEDYSRYTLEVTNLTTADGAVDFLDKVYGRSHNALLRLNNYV